jgi:hypothetical protein
MQVSRLYASAPIEAPGIRPTTRNEFFGFERNNDVLQQVAARTLGPGLAQGMGPGGGRVGTGDGPPGDRVGTGPVGIIVRELGGGGR